jgi:hypothetical protein
VKPSRRTATFELRLQGRGADVRVEEVTCGEAELLTRVPDLIRRERLHSVEVRQDGEHLYTVAG